jgi:two-component system, OmpR family, copper resistance phosphate regulon response regulator CusR
MTYLGMTAVLVIEDDGVIARAMGAHLRTGGFDVEWADDGNRGLRKLRFERPDVCVVDLMLPGLDGWGLIECARDEGLMTPILAVSARGNEHDKVATLALGADDYLAKPFGMAEFMARVQALARRARIAPPSEREHALEFPGLRIDAAQHRAFLLGVEGVATDARLTRIEFRLLHQLARNHGRVLSRDELHQRVWDVPYRHSDRTVDVFVRKLREKLDRRSSFIYVHTHYGVGYRFGAEARGSDAA